jgi:hypothetical protein
MTLIYINIFTIYVYTTYIAYCTCLQHLHLHEYGCSLQLKHAGALKPIVQLVEDKWAWN